MKNFEIKKSAQINEAQKQLKKTYFSFLKCCHLRVDLIIFKFDYFLHFRLMNQGEKNQMRKRFVFP